MTDNLQENTTTMEELCQEFRANNKIDPENFDLYQVKRGLRNPDGTGVMAGLTLICNVHGYLIDDGEKIPDVGRLTYRGIDVMDIVDGCTAENRFGYEEVAWLLLFGSCPPNRSWSVSAACSMIAASCLNILRRT